VSSGQLQHLNPCINLFQNCRQSGRTYQIREKISAGGYGAVYKVSGDDKGGGTYALKEELREPHRGHFKLVMEIQVCFTVNFSCISVQYFYFHPQNQILEAAKNEEQSKRKHFPSLFDQKKLHDRMFIVMTLLGESLADIKRRRQERIFR